MQRALRSANSPLPSSFVDGDGSVKDVLDLFCSISPYSNATTCTLSPRRGHRFPYTTIVSHYTDSNRIHRPQISTTTLSHLPPTYTMSPVSMPVSPDSHFGSFIDALRTAPTAVGMCYTSFFMSSTTVDLVPDAKAAADRLAREVTKSGVESLAYVRTEMCNSSLRLMGFPSLQ